MSLPLLYTIALALATGLASTAASRTTQAIAFAYLVAQIAAWSISHGYHSFQVGLLLTDLLLLAVIGWITVQVPQRWPLACASLQLITVLGHLARLTDPTVTRRGYFVLVQWTAWPALLMILIGIWLDRRAGRISPLFWREAVSAIRTALRSCSSKHADRWHRSLRRDRDDLSD